MTGSTSREVLIVEDEALTRMVAADVLTDCGLKAWEAGNAEEALAALAEHPSISLLFTDVDMPGEMDGLALARHVYEERPNIELVVTSGASGMADGDLPDHGTFLPKPYAADRLIGIVSAKLNQL